MLQAPLSPEHAAMMQQGMPPAPPLKHTIPPVTSAPAAVGRHADLLRVAKGINNITLLARIPLMLGASAFVDDPAQRDDMLNVLDALQLASGAPLLGDKARSGAYTMKHSPDTGAAMRAVGTSVGTEAALQSIPLLSTILSSVLK
jgi:hypothetical protein